MRCLLGVDQGSSATKAVLLDQKAPHHILWSTRKGVSTVEGEGGRVEQDPKELLYTVISAIDEARKVARRENVEISGLGLACQRSGVLAFSAESGAPLHTMLSHRDESLKGTLVPLSPHYERIRELSGLPIKAGYAAPKIAALQRRFDSTGVLVGTLDSFLVWHLAVGHPFVTEHSMASRSQLYDVCRHGWSEELCSLFGAKMHRLPKIVPSMSEIPTGRGFPLRALLGDQQAALFGIVGNANDVVINLGTIASILVPVRRWASDVLCAEYFSSRKGDEIVVAPLTEVVLPRCAPFIGTLWPGEMRAQFDGLSLGELMQRVRPGDVAYFGASCPALEESEETRRDVVRSDSPGGDADLFAFLGILHLGCALVRALHKLKGRTEVRPARIFVTGGLSRLRPLVEFVATLSGDTVSTVADVDATARGAALATLHGEGEAGAVAATTIAPPPHHIHHLSEEYYRRWEACVQ